MTVPLELTRREALLADLALVLVTSIWARRSSSTASSSPTRAPLFLVLRFGIGASCSRRSLFAAEAPASSTTARSSASSSRWGSVSRSWRSSTRRLEARSSRSLRPLTPVVACSGAAEADAGETCGPRRRDGRLRGPHVAEGAAGVNTATPHPRDRRLVRRRHRHDGERAPEHDVFWFAGRRRCSRARRLAARLLITPFSGARRRSSPRGAAASEDGGFLLAILWMASSPRCSRSSPDVGAGANVATHAAILFASSVWTAILAALSWRSGCRGGTGWGPARPRRIVVSELPRGGDRRSRLPDPPEPCGPRPDSTVNRAIGGASTNEASAP